MKKIAVAMSGGVDSGVAAALLVKAGFGVTAFHLKLWSEDTESFLGDRLGKEVACPRENKCCDTASQIAAEKTAKHLGIPFRLVNLSYQFKKNVVDYFLDAYALGLTPNPCVMCNRLIKFGELYELIREEGFDYLATGHYAQGKNGGLYTAKDKTKDQTYFLYNLKTEQLKHLLFPVGAYLKSEVRTLAAREKLPVAARPESQEICFLPETDYRPFLKRYVPLAIKSGAVVDLDGKTIGIHQGLPLYTIGQRHGFTVHGNLPGPFYVVGKDLKNNRLVVGFGKETERDQFFIHQANWIGVEEKKLYGKNLEVKIRHQGAYLHAKVEPTNKKGKLLVKLAMPERGFAPGQAAVFYQEEKVLGGGLIDS